MYIYNITANYMYYRLVHAFTCAGILPQHYIKMCTFAAMGTSGRWYIKKVSTCDRCSAYIVYICNCYLSVYGEGYKGVVERVAEASMQAAVEEAKAQPKYDTAGEV